MPKVSVIIPTYNAKETIEKTVSSVLHQTEQNFEIIIVDDVSKDNTYAILKHIAKQDSRISVFENERNSKSAYTRNVAISKAQGTFIMQLDDDDYCDPTRMQQQVDFLESHPDIDFVGSNVAVFNAQGMYGKLIKPEKPTVKDLLKTSQFFNPSMMFRKETLELVDGYRVSWETARGQDYDMYLRMYIAGLQGYNIQKNLTYYYLDNNYIKKIKWKNRLGEMRYRYRHFKSLGVLPKALPYVVKPLIAIFIPRKILQNKQVNAIKPLDDI